MKCNHIRGLLSVYLDGMTDESESKEVKAHLMECCSCRKELQQLEKLCERLNALDNMAAPVSLLKDLFGKLNERGLLFLYKKEHMKKNRGTEWLTLFAMLEMAFRSL